MGRGRRDTDKRKQPDSARAAGKEACKHDEPPHHRAQNLEAQTREPTEAKRTMLKNADDYERLAQRAQERRAGRWPQSK